MTTTTSEAYQRGYMEALEAVSGQVKAQAKVVEIARRLASGWGHNMPGWGSCTRPGDCDWERLEEALKVIDARQKP